MGLKRSYAIIIGTICTLGLLLQVFLYFQKQPTTTELNSTPEASSTESDGAPEVTHRLLMSITINNEPAGDIEIGLFGKVVPKTVENFRALCTGETGKNKDGIARSYQNTPFHRIIPGFMIQGGDFTRGDGRGGESIYGSKFEDENFKISHFTGCLSMANSGRNTNGSQFFITVAPTEWLDGKHVVFGKITNNMELVKEIERYGSRGQGTPSKSIKIAQCKELPKSK